MQLSIILITAALALPRFDGGGSNLAQVVPGKPVVVVVAPQASSSGALNAITPSQNTMGLATGSVLGTVANLEINQGMGSKVKHFFNKLRGKKDAPATPTNLPVVVVAEPV